MITKRQVQDKNREQPTQRDPYFRAPPRPPDNLWPESPKTNTVTKTKIDIDFEENSSVTSYKDSYQNKQI